MASTWSLSISHLPSFLPWHSLKTIGVTICHSCLRSFPSSSPSIRLNSCIFLVASVIWFCSGLRFSICSISASSPTPCYLLWTRSIVRSRSALRSLAWSAPWCRWQMWKVSSCPPLSGCKRWRWCQSCRSWSVHHFWAKLSSRFTSRVVCGDWLYRWTWSSAAWKLGALALPVRRFRCSSCPRRPWWLVQILFEMKLRRPEKSSASQNEIFVNQPFVPNFSSLQFWISIFRDLFVKFERLTDFMQNFQSFWLFLIFFETLQVEGVF